MFNTVSELKEFIKWAKQEKIAKVKAGDIEFEISALGLMDEDQKTDMQSAISKALGLPSLSPEEAMKEEEDLLFHSSN